MAAVTGMPITAIAPWYGGKRTLAPEIIKAIGPHKVYWELCSGSLAVLFAKPKCSAETIVDLHGDAVNLARVLASDQWWELCDRVQRTLFSEDLFAEAKERLQHEPADELQRAYDYLVVSWMGMNGVAGTSNHNAQLAVRYTSNGGDPARRWRSVGESIPAWHERLSGVRILRRDIFTVCERIEDKAGTVIYIDPPYYQKSHKYLFDFEAMDHARLATALSRFQQTRVVISYYDHPAVRDLYPSWAILPLTATKALVSQGMRDAGGRVEAPEVLLVSHSERMSEMPQAEDADPQLSTILSSI